MVALGGAAALKKPVVHAEQGEIARISAAGPGPTSCAGAFFVRDLTEDSLRTPFIFPILRAWGHSPCNRLAVPPASMIARIYDQFQHSVIANLLTFPSQPSKKVAG